MRQPDTLAHVRGVLALLIAVLVGAPGLVWAQPRLSPVAFADLKGWQQDPLLGAAQALTRSCAHLESKPLPAEDTWLPAPTQALLPPCAALKHTPRTTPALRRFFETWFRPYALEESTASSLATGYFLPEVRAARTQSPRYRYPILAPPPTLPAANLWSAPVNATPQPWRTREAIEAQPTHALLWADDRLDVFILQVQGSGIARLPDGESLLIGYAGHNGHTYQSIARALIERGALKPHQASWRHIRQWLENNPAQADALYALNPRFIFFRHLEQSGPLGNAGVVLTPERSIAVDTRATPYHLPVWIETGTPDAPIQRLTIAQDTGNAIRGTLRIDYYWGHGARALQRANAMKFPVRMVLLIPHGVDIPL